MKKLILLFLVLLLPLAIASECDDFCLEKEFDFGACRATTEEGFCQGNSAETVFGFSTCENYDRCCCGNVDETIVDDEENDSSSFVDLYKDKSAFDIAENMFWVLLVVVAILALAVAIKKKSSKKEEIKEE